VLVITSMIGPRLAIAAREKAVKPLIADFEQSTAFQEWRVVSGAESSAARATLTPGPGHSGRGAILQYEIPCNSGSDCRGAVAAQWTPRSAMPVARHTTVSLWIRFAANVAVSVECKDSSGHAAEFAVPAATLEHPRLGDWQHAVIPLPEGSQRVKGRIAELSIVVRTRTAVTGTLTFDDVRIADAGDFFELREDAPVDPPITTAGELAPRLGVNIHVLRDDSALDRAKNLGFRFVRMDLVWSDVERNGRYRFAGYDALLRALETRGMGALFILDYGHPDHGGQAPRKAEDIAAFGRFAAAVAAHFRGRAVRYEIWNEPNIVQFWKPVPSANEYGALLRETVSAMRAADPSAVISSGGLSRFDWKFLSELIDPELGSKLNAIGIHPYRDAAPESVAQEWAFLSEWVREKFGENPEIWDTEWGYSSVSPSRDGANGHSAEGRKRQAVLAVREFLTVWTLGMPLAVWYDLRDDGPDGMDPEKNYGLLDSNGNDKPAIKALLTLMEAVKNRTFAGMVRDTPAGIHAMRLVGPTDTVMIVWSDRPGVTQTVAAARAGLRSITSLNGEVVKTKEKPSGFARWVLQDTSGPLYLRWDRAARELDRKTVETASPHHSGKSRVLHLDLLRRRTVQSRPLFCLNEEHWRDE
jgi:hypothetical protein